jgi:hypothetical protein
LEVLRRRQPLATRLATTSRVLRHLLLIVRQLRQQNLQKRSIPMKLFDENLILSWFRAGVFFFD